MAREINRQKEKTPMPEQNPQVRAANYLEVALGYTEEQAVSEAKRCLLCKNRPCTEGCPVAVRIPEFLEKASEGDFQGAYEVITSTNALPAICGRVCPQETQCEALCVRGKAGEPVAIGRLERFVADWAMEKGNTEKAAPQGNGRKVAVVGAGPAGLTCAGDLCDRGYEVTVFEALHKPGGVLIYGIPEFRLPKSIVQKEIEALEARGCKIVCNAVAGRSLLLDDLFEMGFEAVFLGTGAGLPTFMRIPGENLGGVYSANEYLTRVNLMRAYDPSFDTPIADHKAVAVVGGGNVAMDAARCALRLGAKTTILYRRTLQEMPARQEEIHHAQEEGVEFSFLTAPIEVLSDENGFVKGLVCRRMELGEPDASGRRSPKEIPGSDYVLEVDGVISAIGTSPNPVLTRATPGLELNKWGCIVADEDGLTSIPGVYAGGDAVSGAATVILAMGAGKKAAEAMDKYLQGKG